MSAGGIPAIPDFTQNAGGTITANSNALNPPQTSESYALNSLLNVVRHIDSEVEKITRAAITPAVGNTLSPVTNNFSEIKTITQTAQAMPPSFPPLYLNNHDDSGTNSGNNNPRNTAPITWAERTAYNLSERRETVVIEVAAAKGTDARIIKAPQNIDIQLVSSGGNI
jgi:hypothetical protein